jgi:hypothetical protein
MIEKFFVVFRTLKSKLRIPVRTGPAIRIRSLKFAEALPDLRMWTSLELDLAELRGEDRTFRTKEVEGAVVRIGTTTISLTKRTSRTVPMKRLPKMKRMKTKQRRKNQTKQRRKKPLKEGKLFGHQTPEVKLPTKVTVGSLLKI